MKRLLLVFTVLLFCCTPTELDTEAVELVNMGCSPWYDDPNNPSCKWRECNGQIERDCLD